MDTSSPIFEELPTGYRWLTPEEVENWADLDNVIQVRVGGTDDDPWTDLAKPMTEWEKVKVRLLLMERDGTL